MQSKDLKKQIEYYLGDTNLEKDDYFREQITADSNGYVALTHFLNCNKIKAKGVKDVKVIAEAVADSTELELSDDKKSVRRAGNKALPEKKGSLRKRDQKAAAKEEAKQSTLEKKAEEEAPVVMRDA